MRQLLILGLLAACGEDPARPVEELRDPNTCMECHPQHFKQWQGSMHAYASDDPVFVAMNKRGQRETGGKLGDFCLKCHAPMAIELGLVDATNAAAFDPATLAPEARGITCYFCHNVKQVTDTHNNGLVLANDQTMRGGLKNPVKSPAHHSSYDKLMDSDINESEMCGSCHDIVVPEEVNGHAGGVAVERTFAEWQTTFFATDKSPGIHLTCGGCHMKSHQRDLIADAPGLGTFPRDNAYHDHLWPAIDQALTPFVETDAQNLAIADILDPAIALIGPIPTGSTAATGGICVTPEAGGTITVRVDGLGIGHKFPSGAAQDRRAWIELVAFDVNDMPVFSTGVVPDGMDPEQIADPNLKFYSDLTFKQDNTRAHFFWEITRFDDSNLLKQPTTLVKTDPAFDHSRTDRYVIGALTNQIDHISAQIHIRALPFEVLQDLVSTGDLSPTVVTQLKTLSISSTVRTWTRATQDTNTHCSKN
jgi:Cytochrome c554 and c-prime